jgi:hypothetical protein
MIDTPFVVQKVEWYQFRDPAAHAFFVMVANLPNGFFTAVPCHVTMRLADHSVIALAATQEEALTQLQTTLAGKNRRRASFRRRELTEHGHRRHRAPRNSSSDTPATS